MPYLIYLILSFSILSCVSCRKKENNNTDTNDLHTVYWSDKRNYILIENYYPKVTGNKFDYDSILTEANESAGISPWQNSPFKEEDFLRNDILTKATPTLYDVKSLPYSFINLPDERKNVKIFENQLSGMPVSNLFLTDINADQVTLRAETTFYFGTLGATINHLAIYDYDISDKMQEIGEETLNLSLLAKKGNKVKTGIKNVYIDDKLIKRLYITEDIGRLSLYNCTIDTFLSIMGGSIPDTIDLVNLSFEGKDARLDLREFDNFLSYAETKNIALSTSDVDLSKLLLDYTRFTIIPSDFGEGTHSHRSVYLSYKEMYEALIENQRLSNNEEGRIKAIIDYAKYEDRRKKLGGLIVFIKTWWNNYGYEKERIVWASLEMFLFFCLMNLFLFRKVRETYEIAEVQHKYTVLSAEKRRFRRWIGKLILCVIYSGYLFFGVKLNLERLKLSNILVSFWIILQYTIGIISLAYIANLIISK